MGLSESLDLPIEFHEEKFSSEEFGNLVNGKISDALYTKLLQGISNCKWAKNLYPDMPSDQVLIDGGSGPFYIGNEHITIEHDCNLGKWCITSWGEYFICFIYSLKVILDTGCGVEIYKRMKTVSKKYMKSINKTEEEEIISFKRENLWNKRMPGCDENLKNKKALSYLLYKLKKTLITNHPSLILSLTHIIFFE